jgi:hypothetical protein
MTDEFEVESETKNEVDNKTQVKKDPESVRDKIKADVEAVARKIQESQTDLGTNYDNKE